MKEHTPIKPIKKVLEDFQDDLSRLIPDIIKYCLNGDIETEDIYTQRILRLIESNVRWVSDFQEVLKWMGMDSSFVKQHPYNESPGTWESFWTIYKLNNKAKDITDHLINILMEIDMDKTANGSHGREEADMEIIEAEVERIEEEQEEKACQQPSNMHQNLENIEDIYDGHSIP